MDGYSAEKLTKLQGKQHMYQTTLTIENLTSVDVLNKTFYMSAKEVMRDGAAGLEDSRWEDYHSAVFANMN